MLYDNLFIICKFLWFFVSLCEVEDMLNIEQEFLEKQIQKESDFIRNNGIKNKKTSMAALKRKKIMEKHLLEVYCSPITLATLIISIKISDRAIDINKSMKLITNALKVAQQSYDGHYDMFGSNVQNKKHIENKTNFLNNKFLIILAISAVFVFVFKRLL